MKCGHCLDDGVVFPLRFVRASSTMLPTRIYQDVHGKHHRHDPNLTHTTYVCPVNHHTTHTDSVPCWCGWCASDQASRANDA